jgi:hypothetical protein
MISKHRTASLSSVTVDRGGYATSIGCIKRNKYGTGKAIVYLVLV